LGEIHCFFKIWHGNFSGSDLPPTVFTLEDRSDFSREYGIPDYPLSPEVKSDPRTPIQSSGRDFSASGKGKSEASRRLNGRFQCGNNPGLCGVGISATRVCKRTGIL
jgi:hypothetical protein